ncbi:MAG: hypothetical protein J3R72DRAFT_418286 [Linnemannia gamsii]|nr:MAG: hypothetical protein J3R72DRAFT_418286 [Linnemannia gamsii]
MPPTHALEIPEILSLIGSFIPIWKNMSPIIQGLCYRHYRPALLCCCLRVSKFWYDTLLPILWYGYWTDNMSMPLLLRGCTNLVKLDILVKGKQLKRQRSDEPVGRPEQQLLRSNPLLKTLRWTGDYKPGTALESKDFVGLKCLETLHLLFWTCDDGQLVRTLKVVSGTLKRLTIG